MVENIKERLIILFPGVVFAPSLSEGDCVIGDGEILEWGRADPQPGDKELNAVPSEDLAEFVAVTLFNAKVKSMTNAIQTHLDTTAQSWGYDNIISLCTYDGNSDQKYSAEGAAGKEWRSSVWRYCEDELAKISEGTRVEPESNEAFIAELPTITRPKL